MTIVVCTIGAVSYTHLRAHETKANLVCRLLLEKENEIDTDTHDALTVIRDFASGSDPKGSLEAESIVILDVCLQENGYAVRGNTRLRKVLVYAEVPGLSRNPQ